VNLLLGRRSPDGCAGGPRIHGHTVRSVTATSDPEGPSPWNKNRQRHRVENRRFGVAAVVFKPTLYACNGGESRRSHPRPRTHGGVRTTRAGMRAGDPGAGPDRDQRGTDGTPSPTERIYSNLYMNLRAVYVRPRGSRRGRLSGRRPDRRQTLRRAPQGRPTTPDTRRSRLLSVVPSRIEPGRAGVRAAFVCSVTL